MQQVKKELIDFLQSLGLNNDAITILFLLLLFVFFALPLIKKWKELKLSSKLTLAYYIFIIAGVLFIIIYANFFKKH